MKPLFFISAIVFFLACDPAYHLTYAVLNNSGQTIYVVDRTKQGVKSMQKIEPDSAIEVYNESGFGSGRGQFQESRSEVASRFVFYSDSTLNDSSQITPRKGWRYYPLPIGEYNARVYIRKKDVK